MFRFFIKRYFCRVSSLRSLFILSVIPAFIYLAAAASRSDRFIVYQELAVPRDMPLAVPSSPSDFTYIDWYIAHQDALFLDAYTMQILGIDLRREFASPTAIPTTDEMAYIVKNTLSLSYLRNMLRITYRNSDQTIGKFLVAFYAQRVIRKAEDGVRRQEMLLARQAEQEGQTTPVPKVKRDAVELKGSPSVSSSRALWRNDRFPMTLLLLVAGFAAILIWIGIVEAADTSLKSERQIARLLHIPVLGSVPNLNRVSRFMGSKA